MHYYRGTITGNKHSFSNCFFCSVSPRFQTRPYNERVFIDAAKISQIFEIFIALGIFIEVSWFKPELPYWGISSRILLFKTAYQCMSQTDFWKTYSIACLTSFGPISWKHQIWISFPRFANYSSDWKIEIPRIQHILAIFITFFEVKMMLKLNSKLWTPYLEHYTVVRQIFWTITY